MDLLVFVFVCFIDLINFLFLLSLLTWPLPKKLPFFFDSDLLSSPFFVLFLFVCIWLLLFFVSLVWRVYYCLVFLLFCSEALEYTGLSDGVFDEECGGVRESSSSSLNEIEEMDLVLSDPEEDGAGEGLSDGKLVIPLGDDDLSLEERRAEQTKVQTPAEQGGGESVKKSEQEGEEKLEDFSEDASKSIEGGVSSLSLGDKGGQSPEDKGEQQCSECAAPERTEDAADRDRGSVEGAASDSPNCDTCTDNNDQAQPPSSTQADVDAASLVSLADSDSSSDSEATVPSHNAGNEASSESSTASKRAADKRVHVHLDNFNTFQYWRSPLPEVDIDFDVINGAPANIHIVAKVSFWCGASLCNPPPPQCCFLLFGAWVKEDEAIEGGGGGGAVSIVASLCIFHAAALSILSTVVECHT